MSLPTNPLGDSPIEAKGICIYHGDDLEVCVINCKGIAYLEDDMDLATHIAHRYNMFPKALEALRDLACEMVRDAAGLDSRQAAAFARAVAIVNEAKGGTQ
jgi:hypothetical protein